MQNANQAIGGQVIEAEFKYKNNAPYYKVEIAKNQQNYDVKIDANTGAVLSQKLD